MEKIGRRLLLVLSLGLSGLCILCIFGIHNSLGTVIFSCVFSAVSVISWNALDVLSVELFPTHKRGTAFGLLGTIFVFLFNYYKFCNRVKLISHYYSVGFN